MGLPRPACRIRTDKTLGIKGKDDAMKMRILACNAECRKIVTRYTKECWSGWEDRSTLTMIGRPRTPSPRRVLGGFSRGSTTWIKFTGIQSDALFHNMHVGYSVYKCRTLVISKLFFILQ